ncbi:MAG TPA: hypothetical protein DD413_02285 [Ruminococcus sp.]|nr:hypothetical protein [Ruminococcus sp.]
MQPYNIISYFELWGCILNGTFGVLPDAIADYIRHVGYNRVDEYYFPNINDINIYVNQYRSVIIYYAHSSGCHYISVRYDSGRRGYVVYNHFDEDTSERYYKSLSTHFIESSYTLIALICVK